MNIPTIPSDHTDPDLPADARVEPDVQSWLVHLALAGPRTLDGLELSPVLLPAGLGLRYLLSHEAAGKGLLEVLEEGGGVVQEALARNLGVEPVLIPEGSSLVGAKQNRVVVETILVAPGQTVPVDVGCVEQGRWLFTSPKFQVAREYVEPMLRRRTVRESAALGHVDQRRLWADVSACSMSRGGGSATQDYHEAVADHRRRAEARARVLEPVPGQVGILARAGGRLLGFEIFGHPETWSALHAGVVPSYLLSAQLASRAGAEIPGRTAAEWLATLAATRVQARPSRGLGMQLALDGEGFAGAGLWADDHLAHLAVFGD